jgi:two-component system sensor histidine kinase UhpB
VQQDIRQLLARLQPFGPAQPDEPASESLARGVALLQALVASWSGSGRNLDCRLELAWTGADGRPQPWPDEPAAMALSLPRALWLSLYRISQEALTNVARHADAGAAGLALHLHGGSAPGEALRLDWCAWDDGCGLPDAAAALPRGNGLAGLQERVWAQGGALWFEQVRPGAPQPGLRLAASFDSRWLPPQDIG